MSKAKTYATYQEELAGEINALSASPFRHLRQDKQRLLARNCLLPLALPLYKELSPLNNSKPTIPQKPAHRGQAFLKRELRNNCHKYQQPVNNLASKSPNDTSQCPLPRNFPMQLSSLTMPRKCGTVRSCMEILMEAWKRLACKKKKKRQKRAVILRSFPSSFHDYFHSLPGWLIFRPKFIYADN